MYLSVDKYHEPHEIINKMKDKYCEMNATEHAFLCGLIRKFSPKKILEVGVAGGGTTAVIMNCLNLLGNNAEMFSVDLSTECYRKEGKISGYQLEEVKEFLPNYQNHHLLLGKTLPHVIENIVSEEDIDFVILDTVHYLPGEILDFLLILPYLKDGAIVIFHDITLNLNEGKEKAYATKIVLDASCGKKYYNYKDRAARNIGAICISKDTRENIANVFSALSISWTYLPSESELFAYREMYKKNYDEECLKLFDIFVECQNDLLNPIKKFEKIKRRDEWIMHLYDRWIANPTSVTNFLKKNEYQKVAIYGAGKLGRSLVRVVINSGYYVAFIMDCDTSKRIEDYQVIGVESKWPECDVIIVTVSYDFEKIKQTLQNKCMCSVVSLLDVVEHY